MDLKKKLGKIFKAKTKEEKTKKFQKNILVDLWSKRIRPLVKLYTKVH